MLVKKSESKKIQNSQDCTVWEYDFPSKYFSYGTALINGRYPEQKRVTNLECEEIYFVISGSGVVHSEKAILKLVKEICIFLKKAKSIGLKAINCYWRWSMHQSGRRNNIKLSIKLLY